MKIPTPSPETSKETLLEFPCEFALKPLGKDQPEFPQAVRAIINEFVPKDDQLNWQERPSGKGTFVCITVTIRAESKQQLDNIYLAFSSSEFVRLAL